MSSVTIQREDIGADQAVDGEDILPVQYLDLAVVELHAAQRQLLDVGDERAPAPLIADPKHAHFRFGDQAEAGCRGFGDGQAAGAGIDLQPLALAVEVEVERDAAHLGVGGMVVADRLQAQLGGLDRLHHLAVAVVARPHALDRFGQILFLLVGDAVLVHPLGEQVDLFVRRHGMAVSVAPLARDGRGVWGEVVGHIDLAQGGLEVAGEVLVAGQIEVNARLAGVDRLRGVEGIGGVADFAAAIAHFAARVAGARVVGSGSGGPGCQLQRLGYLAFADERAHQTHLGAD